MFGEKKWNTLKALKGDVFLFFFFTFSPTFEHNKMGGFTLHAAKVLRYASPSHTTHVLYRARLCSGAS